MILVYSWWTIIGMIIIGMILGNDNNDNDSMYY